ncbi:MAG: hypothetical protein WD341_08760 [Tistlia sp.]|uniref:hypothetical protein n=1 Tax=Tistlia sp. TaxID=3057121 RepID=UPI0034A2DB05
MPSQRLIELFDTQVVVPTLAVLAGAEPRMNSLSARQLLVGTAVAESDLQHALQVPNGPARSRFQIEPGTVKLLNSWLGERGRESLAQAIVSLIPVELLPDGDPTMDGMADHLAFNDWLACGLARVLYWSWPDSLPAPGDWMGHAEAWKRMYNGPGKGTPGKFMERNRDTIAYFERLARVA